jgi:membrane protein DedA with SNARE-associated domain
MTVADLTSSVTSLVEHHGALAVFLLLAIDAVLPVGGELPMLLSGVVAAGALGHGPSGPAVYLELAAAGSLGYLAGSIGGWAVGRRGGRGLVERHGRWLHLGPDRLARAERWFESRGRAAVLIGRVTPLVRSFISVAAGVVRVPFAPYVVLTAIGGAVWCFGLAAVGWAVGSRWEQVHHAFRYAEIGAAVAVIAAAVALAARLRRSRSGVRA